MAQTGARQEPLRGYNFRLEIGNNEVAHFTSCTGLGVDIAVINYREAGNRQIVRKLPGRFDCHPVTFQYGLTESKLIYDWMMSGVVGNPTRQTVAVAILDPQGVDDRAIYNLEDCWVASIRFATLNANEDFVAVETVTVVGESIERKK